MLRSLQVSSSVVKLAFSFLNDIAISGQPISCTPVVTACCLLYLSIETLQCSAVNDTMTGRAGSPVCCTVGHDQYSWWNAYGIDDTTFNSGLFVFIPLLNK